MNKIRLSYTLLSLWDRGDIDQAVKTYFHMDTPTTEAMEDGKRIHEEIAEHIDSEGRFPDWFFGKELIMPETEKEIVVNYNEMFDLKCYIDCVDHGDNTGYEYKTGKSNSLSHLRTWQVPIYFLIAELGGVKLDKMFLIHYNQHEDTRDFAIMHNTPQKREMARNIIDSIGPEIHKYFSDEGLLG